MIKRDLLRRLAGMLVIPVSIMVVPIVFAADLASAKAAGHIGERLDGFLGLVNQAAPADVKKLVNDVNTRRRAEYARIAKQNNVQIDQVAKLTAKKVINAAPKGTFVQVAGGGWRKK